MPMNVEYRDDGGVVLAFFGPVDGQEVLSQISDIYATPDKIKKLAYQLCDFSAVTDFTVSQGQIRALAYQDEQAGKINPDLFIAVVGRQDTVYGLLRMWQASAGQITSMVFKERKEAEQWVTEQMAGRGKKKSENGDSYQRKTRLFYYRDCQ